MSRQCPGSRMGWGGEKADELRRRSDLAAMVCDRVRASPRRIGSFFAASRPSRSFPKKIVTKGSVPDRERKAESSVADCRILYSCIHLFHLTDVKSLAAVSQSVYQTNKAG